MPLAANDTPDKTRRLQIKLYLAAKRSPTRRLHALYDKVHRTDVLECAWHQVQTNRGAPGIDAQTIEAIEAGGVPAFLAALQSRARTRNVPAPGGAAGADPQGHGRRASARRAHGPGPRRPSRSQDRHRAAVRGGLRRLLVRLPTPPLGASGARADRDRDAARAAAVCGRTRISRASSTTSTG